MLLVKTTSREEGVVGKDELQLESVDYSSDSSDCYANKLELNIQRRMHCILRRAYAKITNSQHKKRKQKMYNRGKCENMNIF